MTLEGADLHLHATSMSISGGLNLDGTIALSASHLPFVQSSSLRFEGTQTINGGTIVLDGSRGNKSLLLTAGTTLTLGPDLVLRGERGVITAFGSDQSPRTLVNRGTISAEQTAELRIDDGITHFHNQGLVHINTGGLFIEAQSWSNAGGTFLVESGRLRLGGSFASTDLGTIVRTGGIIDLTGTVENADSVLTLDSSSGSWDMRGGEIRHGTVRLLDGAQLNAFGDAHNRLHNVLLEGDLNLGRDNARLQITGGLDLDGTVTLSGVGSMLHVVGTQTLDGGVIAFEGPASDMRIGLDEDTTLILGENQVVRGERGIIRAYRGDEAWRLINRGTIIADAPNHIGIEIDHGFFGGKLDFVNEGVLKVINGGRLSIQAEPWTNTGTLIVEDGILNLGGRFTSSDIGTVQRSGGTVNITGVLDNTGDVLTLDNTTGPWQLDGGTIQGGVVRIEEDALLVAAANVDNRLHNTSIQGNVELNVSSARLRITGGLELDGAITVTGNNNQLRFGDTQTIDGGAFIFTNAFSTGGRFGLDGDTHLTFGPDLVVRGRRAQFASAFAAGERTITNHGTIAADIDDTRGIEILNAITYLENHGRLKAVHGGILTIDAVNWTNPTGTLVVDGGTLNLGGSFTTADIGNIHRNGGAINITGTLDNAGSVLTLDSTTGSWGINGGTIDGGTVRLTDGAHLAAGTTFSTHLNGVTLEGELRLAPSNSRLQIGDGLELNGTISITGHSSRLMSRTSQTIDGGEIQFGGASGMRINVHGGTTLTLGENLIVRGERGSFGNYGGPGAELVNRGTISGDVASAPGILIDLTISRFTNEGLLQAANGGTVRVSNAVDLVNLQDNVLTGGSYHVHAGSRILFTGAAITTNAADIRLAGPGSQFEAIDGLASNTAQGTFTITGGRDFTTTADFSNAGTLSVTGPSTFTVAGLLTNTGAIHSGSTIAAEAIHNAGDLLVPGLSNLRLRSTDYTQAEDGALHLTLHAQHADAPAARLGVVGLGATATAQLGGVLSIDLADGFMPTLGQRFTVLRADEMVGRFASILRPTLADGARLEPIFAPGDLKLQVIQDGIDWIADDGHWSDTANWSSQPHGPGPADHVIINRTASDTRPEQGYTVTLSSGQHAIRGMFSLERLEILGGNLAVSETADLHSAFTLAGTGTLAGDGLVSVRQEMTWGGQASQDGHGETRIEADAVLNIQGDQTMHLRDGRTVTNAGVTTWAGSGEIRGQGHATFDNLTSFRLQGETTFARSDEGAPRFLNTGLLTRTQGAGISRFELSFDNIGTVDVRSGTIRLDDVVQLVGSTLTGGTWHVRDAGRLVLHDDAPIAVNQASVMLDGAEARFTGLESLTTNHGSLTLAAGHELALGGNLNNTGQLIVQAGSSLHVATTLGNTGTMDAVGSVAAGALSNAGTISRPASLSAHAIRNAGTIRDANSITAAVLTNTGTIREPGTIAADVFINAGRLSAGNGTGVMHLHTASFSQGGLGVLELNLAGPSAGSRLAVASADGSPASVLLDGTLQVNLLNGFTPVQGDRFTVLTADHVLGRFTDVDTPMLGQGRRLEPIYHPDHVALLAMDDGIDWVTDGHGNWSTAGNWSSNPSLPGSGDHVIINRTGAPGRPADGFLVTIQDAEHTIASLFSTERLKISGGTLSVEHEAQLHNSLTLSGTGTLSGAGQIVVRDAMHFSGAAAQEGHGQTIIEADAVLQIDGDAMKYLRDGRTIINHGVTTWAGSGDVRAYDQARFENVGQFRIHNDATFRRFSGHHPQFDNPGKLVKSQSPGTSLFNVRFNNTGRVEVHSGTLWLSDVVQRSGATLTAGAWHVHDGARLTLETELGITTNEASVLLAGAESRFDAINLLQANHGSFAIDQGRHFTSVADLESTAHLGVGRTSSLNVAGLLALGDAHTLTLGVGRFDHGRVHVQGAATLAGTLELVLNGDLLPGEDYEILSADSVLGSFDRFLLGGDAPGGWTAVLHHEPDRVLVSLHVLGDMNPDGVLNTGDIAAFVLALTDPEAYMAQFDVDESTMIALGDINGDGAFNTGDVAPFVHLLVGTDGGAIPEPGSLALLGLGALMLWRRRAV